MTLQTIQPSMERKTVVGGAAHVGGLSADAFLSLGCMEGIYGPIVSTPAAAKPVTRIDARALPGLGLALGLTVLAYLIHGLPIAPFAVLGPDGVSLRHPVSAAIIAILAGLLARNIWTLPASVQHGCKTVVNTLIPITIVCAGATLNLIDLKEVGATALFVTVLSLSFAIVAGYYVGRWFGLGPKTALLLGAGTGICGNSAIMAVAPLIEAEDDDVALSVGTVNLVGLAAMLAWPAMGSYLALSSAHFGVWSGVSIHSVPQVVAAAFAFSPEAGTLATIVKLARVALLAPMIFVLALIYARRHPSTAGENGRRVTVHYSRLIPWFVWGFLALALMNTMGLLPILDFRLANFSGGAPQFVSIALNSVLGEIGGFVLTVTMAAIGLELSLRQLAGVGLRTILAGFTVSFALGAASLMLILVLI